MRGIVLAGGRATRLDPITRSVVKQLLPVYDKPMIYYPVSTLMLAGVQEILIISTAHDLPLFERLLGNGNHIGMRFQYAVQLAPRGIAEALIIGRAFIGTEPVALILGDNIFHGAGLGELLRRVSPGPLRWSSGAVLFGQEVEDPERYGVAVFAHADELKRIDEKPAVPLSRTAITGLYFFDHHAPEYAAALTPSARGELEITDLNNRYIRDGGMRLEILPRGCAWLDTGTADSLLDASNFVATLSRRQGTSIACLEEVAWRMGYIDRDRLAGLAAASGPGQYGKYLRKLCEFK